MKRILLALCLTLLSIPAFAEDGKVYTRISGLYTNTQFIGEGHSDSDSFCVDALPFTRTYDHRFEIIENRHYCYSKDTNGYNRGGFYNHYCPSGQIADLEKMGCYAWREPEPPKQCPAEGTVYSSSNGAFDVPNRPFACIDGCEITSSMSICLIDEIDGERYCDLFPPLVYTGSTCTTSEDGGSGGDDNEHGKGDEGGESGSSNEGDGQGSGGEGEEGGSGEGEGEGGSGSGGEGTGGGSGIGGGGGSGGNGEGKGSEEGEDEEDSSWGGDCRGGFTAEGDALTVAIAKAEWERNCVFIHNVEDSDEYKKAIELKEAPENSDEFGAIVKELPTEEIDVSTFLKSDNILGRAACYPDKYFTVRGRTITIPFSMYCELMRWIGMMFEGLAFILGMRIAFGGGK